ncbi:ABC transporter permease [Nocardioides sp. NPDC000445]|uniref:ABC transporter permease n=1 Tax=Nocardioides sp. NPDC000445 TaxID=3154257 RepID=UPI00332A4CE9
MKVLTIAWTNLRRSLQDRTSAFFFVLFPLLMITVLGVAFGGAYEPRVGVVQPATGVLSDQLVAALEDAEGFDVRRLDSRAEAVAGVEEGDLEAAVVIPATYAATLAEGQDTAVQYLSRSGRSAQQIGVIVRAVVDDQAGRYRVARTLQHELGGDFGANVARGEAFAGRVPEVAVSTTTVGATALPEDLGRFDLGASSQLLLFIFVTSLTAAASMIDTRRLGVARRMFATPTGMATIVAGEALGRVGVALVQGLIIMVGAAVLFGVSWGDPIAAALLMLSFATVAGGAGMVLGAMATNVQQSTAVGLLVGLGAAALGGSMMPLEFYSPVMLTAAHLTPHAWAADGFAVLVRHDGTVLDILPELGVLAAFAAALYAIGSWALRRRILAG